MRRLREIGLALLVLAAAAVGAVVVSRHWARWRMAGVSVGSITILTRDDAIPPDVLDEFTAEFGYDVHVRNFDSNFQLRAILTDPKAHFDLAMGSSFMAKQLLDAGRLRLLNKANLPNIANVDAEEYPVPFDPANDFVVPYQWSAVGIAYDRNSVDGLPKSWSDLFRAAANSKSGGKIALIDNPRNVMGTVLLLLGHSPNTEDLQEIDEAGAVLQKLAPDIADIDTDHALDDLIAEKAALAVAWAPDVAKAMRTKKTLRLSLPGEGTLIFDICFTIPRSAVNQHGAELFANFLLRPEIAARVTNYSYCPTTVKAANAFIDRFIYNGPAYFRNPAGKNFMIEAVSPAADREYYRIWNRLAEPFRALHPSHPEAIGDDPPAEDPPGPAPVRAP